MKNKRKYNQEDYPLLAMMHNRDECVPYSRGLAKTPTPYNMDLLGTWDAQLLRCVKAEAMQWFKEVDLPNACECYIEDNPTVPFYEEFLAIHYYLDGGPMCVGWLNFWRERGEEKYGNVQNVFQSAYKKVHEWIQSSSDDIAIHTILAAFELLADSRGEKCRSELLYILERKVDLKYSYAHLFCTLAWASDFSNMLELLNKAEDTTPQQSGGCYIATAVYGSYDCPEVWTLRRFRDFSLARTCYGQVFIKLYYTVSPILVKWFGNTKWFKNFWRVQLDKLVSDLNTKGFDSTPYVD